MSISVILLTFIFGLLFILYKRWSKRYDYWKERGMVHRKPYPLAGNMMENILKKKSMGEIFSDIALEFKDHKYIGVYNFITADLMITDLEDINTVLIKEFSHFMDRGPEVKTCRTMDRHLFLLTGTEWKGVRTKLSPAFSSGKLKAMLPLIMKSYENTADFIDSTVDSNKVSEINSILDMYILSASASTIYGIEPQRLADPESEFMKVWRTTTKVSFTSFIALTLTVFFPNIAAKLDISPMGAKEEKYFINLVLDTFKERVESGIVKDDIIQQLLQLKQTGKIEVTQWVKEDEEELGSEPTSVTETIEITDDILIAHGFLFIGAGFDPLKSSIGMLLIHLCIDKNIQNKLREEVRTSMEKHNGLTWQAIKDCEYLDWCVSEVLRLYPAVDFNARHCVKDYTFPDGITVESGTRVLIPTIKIHMDPTIYPEPEKFKPERFAQPPEPCAYMPFGMGPRMCIARRLALQEIKVFVARLLMDYNLSLDPKTELPVRTNKWFFLRRNDSPIHVKFDKRKQ